MLNVDLYSLVRQALKYQHTELNHKYFIQAYYLYWCTIVISLALGSNNFLKADLGPIIECWVINAHNKYGSICVAPVLNYGSFH